MRLVSRSGYRLGSVVWAVVSSSLRRKGGGGLQHLFVLGKSFGTTISLRHHNLIMVAASSSSSTTTLEASSPSSSSSTWSTPVRLRKDDDGKSLLSRRGILDTKYLNNADQVMDRVLDASHPERDEHIRDIVREICPWMMMSSSSTNTTTKDDDDDDDNNHLTVELLTGGLSNELFVVSASNDNSHERPVVLVRIHPHSATEIVNRHVENHLVAWLARNEHAPLLYGRFANGRIEEMYPHVTTLSCHDMNHYAAEIGTLMGQLHAQSTMQLQDVVGTTTYGQIWDRLEGWLDQAQRLYQHQQQQPPPDDDDGIPRHSPLDELGLPQRYAWLRSQLLDDQPEAALRSSLSPTQQRRAAHFCRQICLTHMDCQSLNLLRPMTPPPSPPTTNSPHDDDGNNNKPLYWIDFEYAGLNPRACDIANTFCEFCDMNNLRAQYDVEYPTAATQDIFLRSYLAQLDGSVPDVDEAFLAALRHEIGRYTLLSHLSWAAWAVVQHHVSNIEFDYLGYARHRLDGYDYFYQQYWP